jgi:hypothetical protein
MTDGEFARFIDKVVPEPNSGCWLWMGYLNAEGYSIFRIGDSPKRGYRISYEHFKGPAAGLVIRHKCDTRCCVNPDHLLAGTAADNMADMVARGRHSRGSRHWSRTNPELMFRKLTDADVAEIRTRKMSSSAYAERYGVHCRYITSIWRGQARPAKKETP